MDVERGAFIEEPIPISMEGNQTYQQGIERDFAFGEFRYQGNDSGQLMKRRNCVPNMLVISKEKVWKSWTQSQRVSR